MQNAFLSSSSSLEKSLFVYFSTFQNYANKNLYEDNFARASDAAENQIDLLQKLLVRKHGIMLVRVVDKSDKSEPDNSRIVWEKINPKTTQQRNQLYPPRNAAATNEDKLIGFSNLYSILTKIHAKLLTFLSAKDKRAFIEHFLGYFKRKGCDEEDMEVRPSATLPDFLQLHRKDDADAAADRIFLETIVGPKLTGMSHSSSNENELKNLTDFWYFMKPFNEYKIDYSIDDSHKIHALGIPVGEDSRNTPYKTFDESFHKKHPHQTENSNERLTDFYNDLNSSPEVLFSRSLKYIESYVKDHKEITTVYFFTLDAEEDHHREDEIGFDFGAMGSSHYTRHNTGLIHRRIKGLIQRLKNIHTL